MNNKIALYELSFNLIVEEIETKHNLKFNSWVGDIVGYVAIFRPDITLSLDDLLFDLRTDQPEGNIEEWWNTYTEHGKEYESWCKES